MVLFSIQNNFYFSADLKTALPYTKSKILAERAAWDFVEKRKNANLKVFELTTINPSFILGPSMT